MKSYSLYVPNFSNLASFVTPSIGSVVVRNSTFFFPVESLRTASLLVVRLLASTPQLSLAPYFSLFWYHLEYLCGWFEECQYLLYFFHIAKIPSLMRCTVCQRIGFSHPPALYPVIVPPNTSKRFLFLEYNITVQIIF